MAKKYKKINEDTIQETTSKVSKTLHNIPNLKKQRDFLKEELKKIEEILEAVDEL